MKSSTLSQDDIKRILDYEPTTGKFFWKISTSGKLAGALAGRLDRYGYIYITIARKKYKAHRLAWLYIYGFWPAGEIDHCNGNRADNRIANLRDCKTHQNHANRKRSKINTSGYKGVNWNRRMGKWVARIQHIGTRVSLGTFETAEAAHEAYKQAAKSLKGEFANFG